MTQAHRIAVVIGSTRPTRICPDIASWVRDVLNEDSTLHYELLDLAEINLPLLDEPLKAALHTYAHQHTRDWSERVQTYDGFLFVSPQYNWGYPAALKNAIDYLYAEWHDKPATVFTYGARGGGKAAEQLLGVLNGVRMRVLNSHVEAVIANGDIDAEWQLTDPAATLHPTRAKLTIIDDQFCAALDDTQDDSPTP